jgi:hypothetical protein
MLFLGNGKIEEKDLPHWTKMMSLILTWDEFKKEQNIFAQDMRKSEGRISYMTDLWSNPNLDSLMVVTAHYMFCRKTGQLEYWCGLIAFQHIEGSHLGVNLAMHFFKVIDGLGVVHKVCSSPYLLFKFSQTKKSKL